MEIEEVKPEIAHYFPPIHIHIEGKEAPPGTNQIFMDLLGFPKTMGEYLQPGMRFCNLNKMEYEPDGKLPARQKLWAGWCSVFMGQST